MKKAVFFATVVLFMAVMCSLSPNPALAGHDVDLMAPGVRIHSILSLGPAEAVQVLLLLVPDTDTLDTVADNRESACNVEVTFIDSDGNEVSQFETELSRGIPTSAEFNPDPRPEDGRNPYAVEVKIVGNETAQCNVIGSLLVYNRSTHAAVTGLPYWLFKTYP